jgi:hypothetical protein
MLRIPLAKWHRALGLVYFSTSKMLKFFAGEQIIVRNLIENKERLRRLPSGHQRINWFDKLKHDR